MLAGRRAAEPTEFSVQQDLLGPPRREAYWALLLFQSSKLEVRELTGGGPERSGAAGMEFAGAPTAGNGVGAVREVVIPSKHLPRPCFLVAMHPRNSLIRRVRRSIRTW